jgi:hypothetical protein
MATDVHLSDDTLHALVRLIYATAEEASDQSPKWVMTLGPDERLNGKVRLVGVEGVQHD